MHPSQHSSSQPGLLQQLGVGAIARHWKAFFFVALITPAATAAAHLVMPTTYVSEARILVKLGREFMGPPAQSGRSTSMYSLNEVINSEVEILSSRGLAQDVISSMGAEKLYPTIAEEVELAPDSVENKSIETLMSSLSASGVKESSVIRVALSHSDPSLACEALSSVVSHFQARHLDVFFVRLLSAADGSVEAASLALQAAEDDRSRYREDRSVFDTAEERTLLLRRRSELRTILTEARAERQFLGDNPSAGDQRSELFRQETNEIARLRAEESRLLEHYYPHSEAVRALRAQISSRESTAIVRRDAREEALKAEEQRWANALKEIEAELVQVEANERTLRGLDRAVQFQEARLQEAQAAQRAAGLDAKLNAENVTSIVVIDKPSLPTDPVGLVLPVKIIVGVFAGLFIGGSLVMALSLSERGREEDFSVATEGESPS